MLLGHPPVWALLLTTFVTNWTAWFIYSWLPTYFIQAHGFSLRGSGIVSAIPNLAMILAGLLAGWLADRRIAGGTPVTSVRRAFLAGGFAGAMAFLLVIPRATGAFAAVACMSGALACFAFGSSMVLVNSLDLSPRHAGVLVGLQGTAGNIAGMVSPFLGGAIVAWTGRWDLNFYLIAALLAAGIGVWLRWSSGEPVERLLKLPVFQSDVPLRSFE
jgi:MFS family permease